MAALLGLLALSTIPVIAQGRKVFGKKKRKRSFAQRQRDRDRTRGRGLPRKIIRGMVLRKALQKALPVAKRKALKRRRQMLK